MHNNHKTNCSECRLKATAIHYQIHPKIDTTVMPKY